MTGLIVLLFSHGVAPVADHARLEIAFARARDLAASVEPLKPTDTRLRRAAKERFFAINKFLEKYRSVIREKGIDGDVCLNMIMVAGDFAQSYADTLNMPAANLAAFRWSQEMHEAVYASFLRKHPHGGNTNHGDPRIRIELMRENVARALAAYLRSLRGDPFYDIDASISLIAPPVPKPLPPPPQPFVPPLRPFGLWFPTPPDSVPLLRRDYTH